MAQGHSEHLQRVLRGVIAGSDPARLLHEALLGAVAAVHGRQGLLIGVIDGVSTPLASTGPVPRVVVDAAEAAVTSERLARRTSREGAGAAVAEPLRVGSRVVGALAVGGDPRSLDPAELPVFADCASLALSRRPSAAASSAPEVLDAVAGVAAQVDRASVLVRIFDVAESLFGCRSGFCALVEGDGLRVAQYRGLDLERLRAASRHPEFKALLTSPSLRIDPPTHPVVTMLTDSNETAVGLPLFAEGHRLGHLVLFVEQPPDAALRGMLTSFARHVALALRSAELYRRLGDKEEQLISVVHSMANPVVVVDEAGRLVLINGAGAELFQIATAFEIGQPVTGKLGHSGLEALLMGAPPPPGGDIEVSLGTPVPHIYRASVRPVRSSGGRALGRVLVLDDITREREADQLKADFVNVVGNELRSPLTVLKGYIRTLLRRGDELEPESVEQALRAIDASALRLERLLEDMLVVSSIEQRQPTLALAETDMLDVIEAVAATSGGRVRVHRPLSPVAFPLDRTKVEQILIHLIDNALKYSEGSVEVEVTDAPDHVKIAVIDQGPGIFSGDIPLLFERFRQLDQGEQRQQGGTGLGLYICRRLIELHGGRIWCESRLGVGSCFVFELPKTPPAERVGEPPVDDVRI